MLFVHPRLWRFMMVEADIFGGGFTSSEAAARLLAPAADRSHGVSRTRSLRSLRQRFAAGPI